MKRRKKAAPFYAMEHISSQKMMFIKIYVCGNRRKEVLDWYRDPKILDWNF